ncbi:hypothetical protein [Sedimenticola hydrogenitrophicus]|uniref:hypothetical protein n=1 Tax=Sedimenticola hydrogenitrophicus TaxID=2967975 RepID=UPI0021A748F2|nr:hypothetical protein [Sedimenticola hydrogenitrophicus]
MKLLTKALIITSLSLAALTQVQAGERHEGNHFKTLAEPSYLHQPAALKVHGKGYYSRGNWNSRRDSRKHFDKRYWGHRSYDRYGYNRHYARPHYQPDYRYRRDYGRSSGAIIFRW